MALLMMPRQRKRCLLLLIDALMVMASLHLAVILHRDSLASLADGRLWGLTALVVPASLLCFYWLGVYRLVIRYMSHHAVLGLGMAVVSSSLLVLVVSQLLGGYLQGSEVVIHGLVLLAVLGGVRFTLRELYMATRRRQRRPVVIYGAGAAGCELVSALRHGGEYEPMAFVDDWRGLEGALVEGLRVYRPAALADLIEEHRAAMVLLAIPSAPRCRRREILQQLSTLSVPIQTIPGSADVIAGRASISEIRDVALEDLLGREPAPQFPDLMAANIHGKAVMVTGAGGSIGSELCRQIIAQEPALLLMIDNCEFALYAIEQELARLPGVGRSGIEIKPLLVSVQRRNSLEAIFDTFEVHTVYHAAAYKHVPLVEYNLIEGVRNNVFGSLNLARAAMQAGVETFVLVSTDKAVRPTNAMGASKRLTELICQAFAHSGCRTRFCMVRFGNVLGSSGSVVPVFRQQIEQGGPIRVTHPEITRYFMTIPEAAQLVIQAGAMARGGEVYVLDMGQPVRIQDLAVNMIRLSGLKVKDEQHPDGDIEIVHTGLRPGEKLFEELLIGGDVARTRHHRIMTSREHFWEWPRLETFLQELDRAVTASDQMRVRQLLQAAPLAYRPDEHMVDLIWQARKNRLPPVTPPATAEEATVKFSAPLGFRSSKPL
ncbi:polysaccharide biosynthesis protein [Halomonas kalidii]|uniref:Nucleoside-diphosphate sugar epimerase/dehydratase n=1 Tax=Halomonas kalidii TaxID=3043293 RepID=A0ABT6VK62_9GAMM|nr:nucleoside-diphosphate sugar epimerase/dehydratase [Halomonas kalidii]MDI5934372.1 nucleoside-diphosphate sugar epimerase/dehydratase [Halomonas kalidii]